MKIIKFYKLADEFGALSNFYRSPIVVDGTTYKTTEHYFQSMKFTDPEHRQAVADKQTPSGAANLGRMSHPSFRADWDAVKDSVMLTAVRAKFDQHDDLRQLLLSTGDARLVESTQIDSYWADGGDGSGRNQLGITLMRVRAELGGCGIV